MKDHGIKLDSKSLPGEYCQPPRRQEPSSLAVLSRVDRVRFNEIIKNNFDRSGSFFHIEITKSTHIKLSIEIPISSEMDLTKDQSEAFKKISSQAILHWLSSDRELLIDRFLSGDAIINDLLVSDISNFLDNIQLSRLKKYGGFSSLKYYLFDSFDLWVV